MLQHQLKSLNQSNYEFVKDLEHIYCHSCCMCMATIAEWPFGNKNKEKKRKERKRGGWWMAQREALLHSKLDTLILMDYILNITLIWYHLIPNIFSHYRSYLVCNPPSPFFLIQFLQWEWRFEFLLFPIELRVFICFECSP